MSNPHVTASRRYATQVVKGKISACKLVKLACQRYLDDINRSKAKDFPYKLDAQKAENACRLIEALPHVKGSWAKDNLKLTLEPWQCFIVVNLFGWISKETGNRRFLETYIAVPRKNAKSTISAAIGLVLFAADQEHGAECYSGATSEEQAWFVFGPAKLMAEKTPKFRESLGVQVHAKSMTIPSTASFFKPLIGKPGDGGSPHLAVIDEYHEHKDDSLLSTMQTGMGSRAQPLLLVITTAGTDLGGPCYARQQDAVKILEGTTQNERFFALVYSIDPEDDWTSEAALIKANPNYGVSVSREYLLHQQQNAINSAWKQNDFKTKHLNVWVNARSPWMNMQSWAKCLDPDLSLEDFVDEPCFAGVDIASKSDLTSFCQVFVRNVEGVDHYYVFSKHWLPEEAVFDPKKSHYQAWVNEGYLTTTSGNILDQDYVERDIQGAVEQHPLKAMGYDSWNAQQLAVNLQEGKNGRPLLMVDVPQSTRHLSEPMKWVAALADAGRIHHNGDPVLTWCVSNVVAKEDPNGNLFPRKERDDSKIDAAAAMLIAFNRALAADGEAPFTSIYETDDLDSLIL